MAAAAVTRGSDYASVCSLILRMDISRGRWRKRFMVLTREPRDPDGSTAKNSLLLLRNARIVDGSGPEPTCEHDVLVDGSRIKEISDIPIKSLTAQLLDLEGRILMPGLIDCPHADGA